MNVAASRRSVCGEVLIVEGSLPTNSIRALEAAGFQTNFVPDAEATLSYFDLAGPANLLITDVHLGNFRGDTLARQVRISRPDLKVLFVTAFVDDLFNGRSSLEAGEAFLEKPFTDHCLVEAVCLLRFGSTAPIEGSRSVWPSIASFTQRVTLYFQRTRPVKT